MRIRRNLDQAFLGVAAVLILAWSMPSRAEGLADALAIAYQDNPALQQAREQLREADEGIVQARAALGPTVSVQSQASYGQTRLGYGPASSNNSGQIEVGISQTLYSNGRNAAAIDAAKAQILSARQALRIAEGNIMLAVIQAYADVVRDRASLTIYEDTVRQLSDEVTESRIREQDGEITKTDVAQAEAQLAAERALLSSTQAQLQISRAEYFTAVGENSDDLDPPPALPGLPATATEALNIAEGGSPELSQVKFVEQSSAAKVRSAKASNGPSITSSVSGGYAGMLAPFGVNRFERDVSGQIIFSIPLFTSGLNQSEVRQAIDQNTSDRIGIELARRSVVQNLGNAWNQFVADRKNIEIQSEAVRANQAAFTGMRIEQRAGQRATLDVLITEENLVAAQLALLAAQHDQLIAQASILRVIGRLEGPDLIPGLPQYDPAANLRDVERHGTAPWMGVAESVDRLGAPSVGQHPIPAPDAIPLPAALALPSARPPDDELMTALPIAPNPGTVSHNPPPEHIPVQAH